MLQIFLRIAFGVAKTKKRYVGIAYKIYLIKINLLGKLRVCKTQLDSLCLSLSKNSYHSVVFGLPSPMGIPRYLVGRFPLEKPRTLKIFLWVVGGWGRVLTKNT